MSNQTHHDEQNNPINRIEVRCSHKTDEDTYCSTKLTPSEHKTRFSASADTDMEEALLLRCPECGARNAVCPICAPDDEAPHGWFVGESTGEKLPCHNCNQYEVARRRRRGHR